MKVTFKKTGHKEYTASTGERINYYTTGEMGMGSGTAGWYITEINGDFHFDRFFTLRDAKYVVIKDHNLDQAFEATLNKADKTLQKYYASRN